METVLIERNGKLVEVPFNELTIEEEEMIAHSSMGTTSETLERRKQSLPDYKISDETRKSINDDVMEMAGMSLDERLQEMDRAILEDEVLVQEEKPKIFKKIKNKFHL